MKRCAVAVVVALSVACSSGRTAVSSPAPAVSSPSASVSPTPAAGMTLDEEVGAVMMVGFRGALTGAVLTDWTRHQYGGLLIVNLNQNVSTAADTRALIAELRRVTKHRLIAATAKIHGLNSSRPMSRSATPKRSLRCGEPLSAEDGEARGVPPRGATQPRALHRAFSLALAAEGRSLEGA